MFRVIFLSSQSKKQKNVILSLSKGWSEWLRIYQPAIFPLSVLLRATAIGARKEAI